jgi:hypothetical protein
VGDRVGGRIRSYRYRTDLTAEIGSQWFSNGGDMEGLANIDQGPVILRRRRGKVFFTSEGKILEENVTRISFQIFNRILEEASTLSKLGYKTDQQSLKGYIASKSPQYIKGIPSSYRNDAKLAIKSFTNCISMRWGAGADKLLLDTFGKIYRKTGKMCCMAEGNINLLSPLLDKIPEKAIRFCAPVTNVHWDRQPHSVKLVDGSELLADYVLVAVSLGVLKQNLDTMFCPDLPCSKQEAIDLLGFGHINRILLEYKFPFWRPTESQIKLVNTEDNPSWTRGVTCVERVPGTDCMLMCQLGGDCAKELERLEEGEIAESLTSVLRKFLGDPSLPYPSHLIRTKWSSNPYTLGGSSYLGLYSKPEHLSILGDPLPYPECPTLFFAGEATVPGYFGRLGAARLSGLREANRMLNAFNQAETNAFSK